MKIKEWILILLLSCISLAHAENIRGVGKYQAEDGEKLSFIKNQLHYRAFKDVITQELARLKLDPALFWEKYNTAFEHSFAPIEANLKSKFGIKESEGEQATTTQPTKSKEYLSELRYKRLVAESRFGNLGRIFTSYQIERMTRSSRFASNYHIELLAKVDDKLLNQLYMKFTRETTQNHYDVIYLQSNFTLQGLAWPDIGVEDATLFSKAVDDFWKKWLSEKMGSQVNSVEVVDESQRNKLNEYYRLTVRDNSIGKEFANSLLLKIDSTIEKEYFRPAFNKLTYRLKNRINLIDLKMQKIIYYDDLPTQTFTITLGSNFSTSSSVATTLSKYPLNALSSLPTTLATYEREAEAFYVLVTGVRSIQDLIVLKQKLEGAGITLGVQVEMDKYLSAKNEGNIIIHSRVTNEKLEQFFNRFNETEVKSNLIAKTENMTGQHLLKLISTAPEEAVATPENSKEAL